MHKFVVGQKVVAIRTYPTSSGGSGGLDFDGNPKIIIGKEYTISRIEGDGPNARVRLDEARWYVNPDCVDHIEQKLNLPDWF